MPHETEEQRAKRRRQRILFDDVAELYDTCRPSYPTEIIEFVIETASVGPGDAVLDVGCGTGQLTRQLVPYRFDLTAIDIGTSMIDVARRQLAPNEVTLEATSFEDLDPRGRTFSLIISATAFHWVDPDIWWTKTHQLLQPGGWLTVLGTGESYDEPLGGALMKLWLARSGDGGAWAKEEKTTVAETIAATGLFSDPVTHRRIERGTLPAPVVYALEHTRATTLSYEEHVRQSFTQELAELLDGLPNVGLQRTTSLTMAQVLS